MNPVPTLPCKIKARACDWAVEGKGGTEGFREWGKTGKERREKKKELLWKKKNFQEGERELSWGRNTENVALLTG